MEWTWSAGTTWDAVIDLLYAPDLKGRFLDPLVKTHRSGSKLFSTVQ